MIRTADQWRNYCAKHISGGYVAGGDKRKFYDTGVAMMKRIVFDGIEFDDNSRILDIGCGNGRVPMILDGEGYSFKSYHGIDVIQAAINYSTQAFKSSPAITFDRWDVLNTRYNPRGKQSAIQPTFPTGYNLVLANSLFTHLGEWGNSLIYMTELVDGLVSGGKVYSTWFRSPPNKLSDDHKRTVYKEDDILSIFASTGLTITETHGGDTTSNHNQWRIVAIKDKE